MGIIEQGWALGIDVMVSCGRDDRETIAVLLDRVAEGDDPTALPWPKTVELCSCETKQAPPMFGGSECLLSIRDSASPYPSWYTPSKARKMANRRVRMGLHPTGMVLGSDGNATCGTCTHRSESRFGKCSLMMATHGPATDVIRKWKACVRYEKLEVINENSTRSRHDDG